VDADAKFHPACFINLSVSDAQFLLDRYRTAHSLNCRLKLSKNTVTGRMEDAPLVTVDQTVNNDPMRFQSA
jgi:hypothetical protein